MTLPSKAAIAAWLRQPTTIASLATLTGACVAVALKQMSVDAAVAVASGALVGLVLPDNAAARAGAGVLAADLLAVVRSPNAGTVGHFVGDAANLAMSVQSAPDGTATAAVAVTAPSAGEAAAAAVAAAPAMAAAVEEAAAKE